MKGILHSTFKGGGNAGCLSLSNAGGWREWELCIVKCSPCKQFPVCKEISTLHDSHIYMSVGHKRNLPCNKTFF